MNTGRRYVSGGMKIDSTNKKKSSMKYQHTKVTAEEVAQGQGTSGKYLERLSHVSLPPIVATSVTEAQLTKVLNISYLCLLGFLANAYNLVSYSDLSTSTRRLRFTFESTSY